MNQSLRPISAKQKTFSRIALPLLTCCLTLFACSHEKKSIGAITETKSDVSDTIPLSDLSVSIEDSLVNGTYYNHDQLFNGHAIEYEEALDGTWSFVYTLKDGVMTRLDVYGVNNYQHRFVEMKDGFPYHTVMYYRNGNKSIEEFYDKDKNPIGTWTKWLETGEVDWEKKYD